MNCVRLTKKLVKYCSAAETSRDDAAAQASLPQPPCSFNSMAHYYPLKVLALLWCALQCAAATRICLNMIMKVSMIMKQAQHQYSTKK